MWAPVQWNTGGIEFIDPGVRMGLQTAADGTDRTDGGLQPNGPFAFKGKTHAQNLPPRQATGTVQGIKTCWSTFGYAALILRNIV